MSSSECIHLQIHEKVNNTKSEEKKKKKVTEWWASELLCIAAWILNSITLGMAVTLTTEWMVPSVVVLYGSVGGFPFLWDLNILVYKRNQTGTTAPNQTSSSPSMVGNNLFPHKEIGEKERKVERIENNSEIRKNKKK